jgi:hypothetical protein
MSAHVAGHDAVQRQYLAQDRQGGLGAEAARHGFHRLEHVRPSIGSGGSLVNKFHPG